QQERQQEEDSDAEREGDDGHERNRTLAELDPFVAFLARAGGLERRAPDQPARPDEQRLVEDDQSAQEPQLRPACPVDRAVEARGRVHDPAVRVAEGNRNRVAAAHEDAFDQRLAPVGVARHSGSLAVDADRTGRASCRAVHQSGWWAAPGSRPKRALAGRMRLSHHPGWYLARVEAPCGARHSPRWYLAPERRSAAGRPPGMAPPARSR